MANTIHFVPHCRLEENEHLLLTPFEKNIEVWKQLWRVIERSDLVVQIVDARDPLLFRSPDLEKYVDEFPDHKLSLILMNKADLLSEQQRNAWAEYFKKSGMRVLFFSARAEMLKIEKELAEEQEELARQFAKLHPTWRDLHEISGARNRADSDEDEEDEEEDEESENEENAKKVGLFDEARLKRLLRGDSTEEGKSNEDNKDAEEGDENEDLARLAANRSGARQMHSAAPKATAKVAFAEEENEKEKIRAAMQAEINAEMAKKEMDSHELQEIDTSLEAVSGKIFTRTELFDYFYAYVRKELGVRGTTSQKGKNASKNGDDATKNGDSVSEKITVGMVGYPNVGKSSTVNVLAEKKKVAVSSTPGKTKHFQTLQIHDNITLCDCPGLVFPTFMSSKAEMFCNGLLRIAEMRECLAPTSIVTRLVPRREFEYIYGISLPKKIDPTSIVSTGDGKVYAPKAKLTPQQLLGTYSELRGFYITAGKPDFFKASRLVLNDFVDGKLLFCRAPPDSSQKEFSKWTKYHNPDLRVVQEDAPVRPTNRHATSSSNKHAPVRSLLDEEEDDFETFGENGENGDIVELSPEDLMNLNDPEEMQRFSGKAVQQHVKPKHARINRKQEKRRQRAGQTSAEGVNVDFKPGMARDVRTLPTNVKLAPGKRAPGSDPSSTAAGRTFVAQTKK